MEAGREHERADDQEHAERVRAGAERQDRYDRERRRAGEQGGVGAKAGQVLTHGQLEAAERGDEQAAADALVASFPVR